MANPPKQDEALATGLEEVLIDYSEPSQQQELAPTAPNPTYSQDLLNIDFGVPSQPPQTHRPTDKNSNYTKSFEEDLEYLKELGFHIDANKTLGSGAYGVVYRGTYGPNAIKQIDKEGKPLKNVEEGSPFACKYVDFEVEPTNGRLTKQQLHDSYQIEKNIMNFADHENITPLRITLKMGETNTYTNETTGLQYTLQRRLYLIMDFAELGSLFEFMAKKRLTILPTERIKLILDCILGLEYLHKNNIAHGDVHSRNVLIFQDCIAKWTDFGKGYWNKDNHNDPVLIKKKRWDCRSFSQRVFGEIFKGRKPHQEYHGHKQLCDRFFELRTAIETIQDLDYVLKDHKFADILNPENQ